PAPRGVPQIEVAFDIDANGIMHVTAKDLGTGREQKMTVTGGSSLPKDDIDRMMREAEQHAEEDRRRREAAETLNHAEQVAYQTEKLLTENADNIPAQVRGEVDSALAELKQALRDEPGDGDRTAVLRQAADKVTAAAQKVGTAMYAQAQAQGQDQGQGAQAAGGAGGAAQEDEVVDAEIVDEDKRQEGTG
ncbi:Hsp70 family protein, partial [Streptomyces bobili]|uniref:Hsp70 family protein n=1 Tax=Streptomyces bobili TaxID=67280 RepID=UPI0033E0FD83